MRQRLHRSAVVGWAAVAVLGAGCSLFGTPIVEEPAPASPPASTPSPRPTATVTPTPTPSATPAVPSTPAPPASYAGVKDQIVAALAAQTGYPEAVVESYLDSYFASQGYTLESYLAAAGIAPEEVPALIAEAQAAGIDTPQEALDFLTEVINRPPA